MKVIETAGRLVANRNAPGSGVTAPYGTIDDTGRVQLSQDAMIKRVLAIQRYKRGALRSQTGKSEGCRRRKCPE